MGEHIRVLIVEDSAEDTLLIVRELQRGGFNVDFHRVETQAELAAALDRSHWHVIISDYSLPRFNGLDALTLCLQRGIATPFIIVSGAIGEERAVEMVKAGAHDYVMKDNLHRIVPVIQRELSEAQDRLVRRHNEAINAYLASVVQSSDDAIIGKTLDGTIVTWNAGAERLYGYTAAEMLGRSMSILMPVHRPDELADLLKKIGHGEHVESLEAVRIGKNGKPIDVFITISPIRDQTGRIIGASSIARDITRRKLEETDRLKLIEDLTAALTRNAPEPPHRSAKA